MLVIVVEICMALELPRALEKTKDVNKVWVPDVLQHKYKSKTKASVPIIDMMKVTPKWADFGVHQLLICSCSYNFSSFFLNFSFFFRNSCASRLKLIESGKVSRNSESCSAKCQDKLTSSYANCHGHDKLFSEWY